MKHITITILLLMLIFTCKTIPINIEKNDKNDKNEKKTEINEKDAIEHDAESFFELDGFEFYVDGEKSSVKDGIYDVTYDFKFLFKTNKYLNLSFKIYDIDNNVLYEKKDIKTGGISVDKKEFYYEDSFKDKFSHSMLLYSATVEINKKNYEFTGEFVNDSMPSIDELKTGPIITRYENKKTNVSLYIDLIMKNCSDVTWIHLIPPSAQYYWSLQVKNEDGFVKSNSIINDTKHINYIDNGTYILQINLGTLGIIQKEFNVTDYLNNKSGPNYGLPVAGEKNADKNMITLDMDFLDKVDYVELTLFSDKEKNAQKLGTVKFATPVTSILKKELFEMFFDDNDNRVKLKYNKKYYYKISVYSREYNLIRYISISDPIPVTFPGFKLFDF